jgi:tryptophan 2,3-dioxygenase
MIRNEKDGARPKQLTYSRYLKIDEIIGLQRPVSKPVAHDEMLFIIVHQTYELWFKEIGFELTALIGHLHQGDLIVSYRLLDRLGEIFRVLIQQVDVLETMTPVEFNLFRSHINPASGFQSFQFREFELLAGADPSEYDRFSKLEPEWKERLKQRVNTGSLRGAFIELLRQRGLAKSSESAEILKAVSRIYSDPQELALQNLCEHLIRFDELVSLWRFRHVQMVERMIGMKPGTGGSLGVAYLRQTLKTRYFSELWEARTHMEGGPGIY